MFRRILVPLDGSELAERALPIAARLARASGGSITFLRVVPSPLEFTSQPTDSAVPMQAVSDSDLAGAAGYLTRITASSVSAGVATTTAVFKGMPAGMILRKGGPVPASPHPDALRPLRVLVALDGSARAEGGIEPAAYLVAALAAPWKGAANAGGETSNCG